MDTNTATPSASILITDRHVRTCARCLMVLANGKKIAELASADYQDDRAEALARMIASAELDYSMTEPCRLAAEPVEDDRAIKTREEIGRAHV